MRLLIILLSFMLAACGEKVSFSPDSATYQLSTCHQQGMPEQITLKEGVFGFGPVQTNGEHELEIAVNQHYSGITAGSGLPFTLVELSCQQWGANYAGYEWFIFSSEGKQIAKFDESTFTDSYAKINHNPIIWFSNSIPDNFGDMINVDGSDVKFRFAAGGSHADPDSIVTFSYQVTDKGLQQLGQPKIEKYQ